MLGLCSLIANAACGLASGAEDRNKISQQKITFKEQKSLNMLAADGGAPDALTCVLAMYRTQREKNKEGAESKKHHVSYS